MPAAVPANRPSLLKATLFWFLGALVASAALIAIGLGGNPLGLVIIGLAPWLFWLGPLWGAWKAREALEAFAEQLPSEPEAVSPILGYPTYRWPGRKLEVEARFHGPVATRLVIHKEGYGAARVGTDRAREAARDLLEGRFEVADG